MSKVSQYHHGNLKQALLNLALEILEQRGLETLSLRELARALEVSNNAPYRHFKNREALLEAMATEGFRRLTQACKTTGGDWRRRIKQCGLGYIGFARQQPALFRLMFGQHFTSPDFRAAAQASLETLKDIIVLSKTPRPEMRLLSSWGLVHGLAHIAIDNLYSGPIDERLLAEAMVFAADTD